MPTEPRASEPARPLLVGGDLARLSGLASSLAQRTTVPDVVIEVVRQTVAAVGSRGGVLVLLRPDGQLEPAAMVGYPQELVDRFGPIALESAVPLSDAVVRQAPVFLSSPAEMASSYPMFAAGSPDSSAWAVLPLIARGHALGALGVSFDQPRALTDRERLLLLAMADQAALALDRIALGASSGWGAEDPGRHAGFRLGRLEDLVARLAHVDDLEDVLEAVAAVFVPPTRPVALEVVIGGEVLASSSSSSNAAPRGGPRSRLRLDAGGAFLGELVLVWPHDRPAPASSRGLMTLAALVAPFVSVVRPTRTSAVVRDLEASLLPNELPDVPGLELAVDYVASDPSLDVGGDVYDVMALADGRIALLVADVAGRGPKAAGITNMVRHTVRALLPGASAPSEVLHELNRLMLSGGSPRFCTAALAVLRPDDGGFAATLCRAGHPFPYIIDPELGVERLAPAGALLGVSDAIVLDDVEFRLGPGASLLLYTDGLSEVRGFDDRQFGEGRLEELLQAMRRRTAGDLVRVLRAASTAFGGRGRDDLVVLVAGVNPGS